MSPILDQVVASSARRRGPLDRRWRDHAAFEATQLAQFRADLCDRLAQRHSAAARTLVDRLPVDWVAVDTAAVVSVAEETGLTAYDASYLWLARELRADLVTLDAALGLAAGF